MFVVSVFIKRKGCS